MEDFKTSVRISVAKLEPLRPIFKSWFSILKEFGKKVPGDSPFWYRERPQVGFLAAAAWRLGWVALEEWGTEKGPHREPSSGRNDLRIRRGKHEWFLEAKHTWCDIDGDEEGNLKTLTKALQAARRSARMLILPRPRGMVQKVAVVFVSPTWKPSGRLSFAEAQKQWKKVCQKTNADIIALLVQPNASNCPEGKRKERFIGSALLLAAVE
jgi:hypothetical protein